MKKITLTLAGLLLSASISAQEHVAADGTVFKSTEATPAAQLCMAALESREALRTKAKALGMNRKQQNRVVCNDMSLVEFAKAYRDDIREWSIATVQ